MDEVLEETLSCLRFHLHEKWGDREPFDVFNRLLAKHFKTEAWTANSHMDVKPHEIKSHREMRTTEQLSSLARGHARARPANTQCPIIIAVYGGRELLLDGNNRINFWIAKGVRGSHDVNVHVIDARHAEPGH